MSKVIRATGTNVTASDDAYIISKLFEDGLFSIPNITISGNKLHITSFRGVVAGRDFQDDEQDVNATMGAGRNATQFKIYVDINLGNSDKIRIVTSQTIPSGASNTDILGGTHFYLELGTYTATNISITNVVVSAKTAKNIVTKDNLVVPGKIYANSGLIIGGNDTFITKDFTADIAPIKGQEARYVTVPYSVPAGYKLLCFFDVHTVTWCISTIKIVSERDVQVHIFNWSTPTDVTPNSKVVISGLFVKVS